MSIRATLASLATLAARIFAREKNVELCPLLFLKYTVLEYRTVNFPLTLLVSYRYLSWEIKTCYHVMAPPILTPQTPPEILTKLQTHVVSTSGFCLLHRRIRCCHRQYSSY